MVLFQKSLNAVVKYILLFSGIISLLPFSAFEAFVTLSSAFRHQLHFEHVEV